MYRNSCYEAKYCSMQNFIADSRTPHQISSPVRAVLKLFTSEYMRGGFVSVSRSSVTKVAETDSFTRANGPNIRNCRGATLMSSKGQNFVHSPK